MLSTVRHVADEIVVAVDDRLAPEELGELREVADAIRLVTVGSLGSERLMNWLLRQCSSDWIMRLDSDEVPSVALVAALPDLIADAGVVQHVLSRRWCYPDPYHWLDERPWAPDWQARLSRNLPTLRLEPQPWHAGIVRMDPHRFVPLPIYHLDCAITSVSKRRDKADMYERLRPGHATEEGFNVNWFYLPEVHARQPPTPVPAEDAEVIASILASTSDAVGGASFAGDCAVPLVPVHDIDRHWAHRSVSGSAYRATLTVLEPLPPLRAGATTSVTILASNQGNETWPWGDHLPAFRLGHRWINGAGVTKEGGRTFFTADVAPGAQVVQPMSILMPDEPGDYTLVLDLVHEHERWFECGPRIEVTVMP